MKNSNDISFDDIQGLVRFGHGALQESCFLLLKISDANAAKKWIDSAPFSHADKLISRPKTALQIAISVDGLRLLGLKDSIIDDFSDEFISGMSGDKSRSRRLGDMNKNHPNEWSWGGKANQVPHILLLLYAEKNGIELWKKTVKGKVFSEAFDQLRQLPTQYITQDGKPIEPFGFRDGISQPTIDWKGKQSTGMHDRDQYSNLLAPGEVVLGYPNEYGFYTTRPLIDPREDPLAKLLPDALDHSGLKDFARNGSYLVLRQLGQDVPGFWQFINKQAGGVNDEGDKLAAAMVGRQRDGTPLVLDDKEHPTSLSQNSFSYRQDPQGIRCPIGAHIRRSNPRNGDLPAGGGSCFISRMIKKLGFGQISDDEDLIASTRFHRILRRGRSYGSQLEPEEAKSMQTDTTDEERGLQFICLVANISRQFEFVQNAWAMSSQFAGLQQETDPLLGNREPLMSDKKTDQFNQQDPLGAVKKTIDLPQFVTVRGGGYFFMPGISALKYIASLPSNKEQ